MHTSRELVRTHPLAAALGLCAGLLLGLSCGSAAKCGPGTCAGCCDATGLCQTGNTLSTCGTGASACQACRSGETCATGQCTVVGGGPGGGTAGGSGGGAAGGSGGGTAGGSAGGTAGGSAGGTAGGSAGGTAGGSAGGTAGGSAGGTAGGSAGGAGGGTGGGTGGGASCTATQVACDTEAIAGLNLQSNTSTGAVTNTADGAGWRSAIDATAGGLAPTMSFVYAKFTTTGLQKVSESDLTALGSMTWDIAFRRYLIRLNGGDSGPACTAAAATAPGTSYDTLTAEPAGLTFTQDDFLTSAPTCSFIDDGSGLSTPTLALNHPGASYFSYSSCVAMTGRVFIIHTSDNRVVKLTVTGYYQTEAAQSSCDTSGNSNSSPGGYLRVRWQYVN